MKVSNIESLAYLGPDGSFSSEVARAIQTQDPRYATAKLIGARTITDVCQIVADGVANRGIVPAENSTDGPITLGLEGLRRFPLIIRGEFIHPVRQSLHLREDATLNGVRTVISHPSALGQCARWLTKNLPWAERDRRNSTVTAILEAVEDPTLAAIGPQMAVAVQTQIPTPMKRIDNIHDNPLNATRFFVVGSSEDIGEPITDNDKTSMIVQIPDQPGGLYLVLDTFTQQGINLAKIKSFGKDGANVAFFMTLNGHQQQLPLDTALRKLSEIGADVKPLGSYPQAGYQLPEESSGEPDFDYVITQLRSEVANGINGKDKTVLVYTVEDKIGALRDTLEPFRKMGINLHEIDSRPTGLLGVYAFYLSFSSGERETLQAIGELSAHCTRMKVLDSNSGNLARIDEIVRGSRSGAYLNRAILLEAFNTMDGNDPGNTTPDNRRTALRNLALYEALNGNRRSTILEGGEVFVDTQGNLVTRNTPPNLA